MLTLSLPLLMMTLGAASPQAARVSQEPRADVSAHPLRGPRATVVQAPATIVVRNFEGRIVPIDGEPEVAALRALPLDDAQREAIDVIVARRIAFFDELVRTNIPELERGFAALGRLEHAANGAERWAAISQFSNAWEAFRPWRERGSAIDEASSVIPRSWRRRAQQMTVLYHAAVSVDRAAELGLEASNPQVQAHVRLEAFAALLQASFERQQRTGEEDLDRLARELRLSPEQAERARAIFGGLAEKEMRREAGTWERVTAISEFMRELSPDQRVRAWRYLRREARER